jgi:glycosyltransferase involved in cell wall biosynthesis
MENKKLKEKLPVGILIHEHTAGGSFVLAEKLSRIVNGKLILLSSHLDLKENQPLIIKVIKIFNKRIFANPLSIYQINKKISIWHIHYASPIIFPLFFISKKPKISTFHYMFSFSPFRLKTKGIASKMFNLFFILIDVFFLNIYVYMADKFTFITNAQMHNFRKNILFKSKFDNKSIIIQNFIGKDLIINKSNIHHDPGILFVGKYTQVKGFNDLLEVAEKIPNVNFSLIGDNNFVSTLPNVMNQGEISNQSMVGEYDKNSILVLPSYTEVFPMVILEAMARGLVILVSDIPGMREIMQEERNGYFFPAGDTKKMEELILYLKNNPKEIERISRNNLEDIWKFTAEKQIPKYIKLYEDILR